MSDLTSRDFRRPEHHEFYKLLRDVAPYGAQAFHSIFTDFLTLAHAALYQPVHKLVTDKINDELEAEYLRTIGKYDKERAKNFSAAMGTLVSGLETELHDFLGDVYGCTGISNHWAGQFFTTWPICQMMAKLTVGAAVPAAKRLTVQEPAVGGGAMLLAVACELRAAKFHPRHWWFEAIDVDLRCAHMAYIQLSLAGCPGVVRHGNSLTNQMWHAWPTATGALFPHRWGAHAARVPASAAPPKLLPPLKPGQLYFPLAA